MFYGIKKEANENQEKAMPRGRLKSEKIAEDKLRRREFV